VLLASFAGLYQVSENSAYILAGHARRGSHKSACKRCVRKSNGDHSAFAESGEKCELARLY
jgi:hypothetical protein